MKHRIRPFALLVVGSILFTGNVLAQRVNFGLYAKDDLVITKSGSGELNFNSKEHIILANQTVTINLVDNETAVMSIVGRLDQEITVTIDAPATLDLDPSNKINLAVKFAYSNTGASTEAMAKGSAIEMAQGFTSATFPIIRRDTGRPAPPPTPAHGGYSAPTGTAYLFIYGTLGAVPYNAKAGIYTGDINIHVSYSSN